MEFLSTYRESYTVPIYRLMIEQHSREGTVEWYNGDRVLRQFGCIQYIPDPPLQDNLMARRPQMDISSDLQPLLEYIQWYSSTGKPYLLGGQLTVVTLHMQRPGAYEPVAYIVVEPEPEADLEPEPELEAESE
ncbi:hypothetical protein PVK06_004898 [Gossypium arboreum]|uniref:Uncharacterized protein n=1 Tax=Gossypium arboreum TaxID=29729 RepID=A0ABR0QUG5_GOSAR|nr:hypothetical protein PVK06_004898 [Gossypium arboreum]